MLSWRRYELWRSHMKYILGQYLYLHLFILLYKRGTLLPLVDQCILIVSPTEITKIIKGPSQVCITVNFIRNHGMHVTRQHRRELY